MASLQDERGFNQGFLPTKALKVRTDRRIEQIKSSVAIQPNEKVLEIGCGTGEISFGLSKEFENSFFVGADLSKKFITFAEANYQRENLRYKTQNFLEEELQERYDCIIGNGILHHLYHRLDESLLKMFSLLNPGGRIAFWEPNLVNPYCYFTFSFPYFRKRAKLEPDEMAFTKKYIYKKLKTAGFDSVNAECKDFLLPNTPDFLISTLVGASNFLERTPLSFLSQSLFISAKRSRQIES